VLSDQKFIPDVLVEISPFGSGLVDHHIFADQNPESPNVAESNGSGYLTLHWWKKLIFMCPVGK